MTIGRTEPADVVIVGAGSAGCVLAERLSRDHDRSVVLVERGSDTWPADSVRDLRRLPIGVSAAHAVSHPADSGLQIVRGSGLGGSSVINGGYFLRWHVEDFHGWPDGWGRDEVETAYTELDGPGGAMGVDILDDSEIGDTAMAFESYWSARMPSRPAGERWPIVGLNRVPCNRAGRLRMTAAEAYLRPATGRPNLRVLANSTVDALAVTGGRTVTGVQIGSTTVRAGEVILCAGTIGTAGILLRSGLSGFAGSTALRIGEHRSLAVTYRRPRPAEPGPLLPTVVHTDARLEIRCYRDDLAAYIDGLPRSFAEIGVAAMHHGVGWVRSDGHTMAVDFDEVDADSARSMRAAADEVAEMLADPTFADVADPDSITVAEAFGTSQHAWGSLPMGELADGLGSVVDTRGLRVVDGSILPTGGRSGPHATIMMMACRIGDVLAAR
ncbi:mycofactocin system GMC family oxidoreductase MftG [Gordonia sp. ABSL1-1]|uniref:mycofactocin system GMC family oxidoreductase MftG n=1 Tax=Gordonia sp. ABSL1-1 TaxID=3053923 RepID=UPI0025737E96|nr:mycofactocin system GMC family oxidoreductase MftG [Gordonia sp. ABSL1-1]MDL9937902.1 mycofactocin system GMC family oxidoreductase MftG [Gordonia sp. ABSL1-1]